MKRFLFLFSDTGGGHRASAQAVKGELERLYGDQQSVAMIDIFIALGQWPFARFPEWYPTVVGLNGVPWGMGFHLSDDVKLMKTMSQLVWPYARTAMCRFLQQHPADVIVSFHPIPNCSLFLGLQHLGLQTPVAVVAVDLVTTHASWFVPGADLCLVPTPAARARALRCGIPAQRVRVRGMPTRRSFATAMVLSQQEARLRLGLSPDRKIVLIVGGGDGMGPLGHVVRAIARTSVDRADIVVITGRNRALYEALSRHFRLSTPPASDASLPNSPSAQERRQRRPVRGGSARHSPIRIMGFVDNMEVWMRAADILVTKAGPNSVAEAFVAGLPLVLYTALPGQEEGNVTYVVDNGAGIWSPLPRQAARAVARLLDDTTTRVAMAARSRALAKPWAAEHIAQDLWTLPCHDQRQYLADERYSESHLAHHPIVKHSLRGTRNREVSGW